VGQILGLGEHPGATFSTISKHFLHFSLNSPVGQRLGLGQQPIGQIFEQPGGTKIYDILIFAPARGRAYIWSDWQAEGHFSFGF